MAAVKVLRRSQVIGKGKAVSKEQCSGHIHVQVECDLSLSLGCYRCTSFLSLRLFPHPGPDFSQSLKYAKRNVAGWRRSRDIFLFFFFVSLLLSLSPRRRKSKLCQAVRTRDKRFVHISLFEAARWICQTPGLFDKIRRRSVCVRVLPAIWNGMGSAAPVSGRIRAAAGVSFRRKRERAKSKAKQCLLTHVDRVIYLVNGLQFRSIFLVGHTGAAGSTSEVEQSRARAIGAEELARGGSEDGLDLPFDTVGIQGVSTHVLNRQFFPPSLAVSFLTRRRRRKTTTTTQRERQISDRECMSSSSTTNSSTPMKKPTGD